MARPRSSASVRKLVSQAVAESYSQADIKAMIDASLGATTQAAAECPQCGHAMRVQVPDFKKQVETLISLLEQAEGKAEQAKPEATTVIVERPAR